jgi:hypothetical protein
MAVELCDVPIALVSFVDPKRDWFKVCAHNRLLHILHTLGQYRAWLNTGSLPTSFCRWATSADLRRDELFEVPDTLKDIRFRGSPLVR